MTNDEAAQYIADIWAMGDSGILVDMFEMVELTGWTEAQIREYLKMWDDSFDNDEKVDWRNVEGLSDEED